MKPFRALASLKLTVGLLAAAGIYAILTGFTALRFTGPIFLAIVLLFQLNLAACTVRRAVVRPHRALRDYVPDAIHIGLFVLIAGAAVTTFTRSEQPLALSTGDSFTLAGRWELTLTATEQRPENWVSTFSIADSESGERRTGSTSVNQPLRVGPNRLYQTAWERAPVVSLAYEDGRLYTMAAGEGFQVGDELFVFERDGQGNFLLEWSRDGDILGRLPIAIGQELGGLTVTEIDRIPRTVITVVRDPGVPVVFTGAVIMTVAMMVWALTPKKERA